MGGVDDEKGERMDSELWEVNHAAARFTEFACSVSARHLKDRWTRMQFNRELAYYAKRVADDVYNRRISPEQGLQTIRAEKESLMAQVSRISMQAGGIVGGASQVLGGVGACVGSLGTACAFLGAPMIAHGGNNIYENARGMLEGREDVVGPVKEAYQYAARKLGYSEREGTIAYYSADLVMSGGALLRKIPRRNAWRLFKYLDVDKERAFRQASRKMLTIEGGVDVMTLWQLYKEYEK